MKDHLRSTKRIYGVESKEIQRDGAMSVAAKWQEIFNRPLHLIKAKKKIKVDDGELFLMGNGYVVYRAPGYECIYAPEDAVTVMVE